MVEGRTKFSICLDLVHRESVHIVSTLNWKQRKTSMLNGFKRLFSMYLIDFKINYLGSKALLRLNE